MNSINNKKQNSLEPQTLFSMKEMIGLIWILFFFLIFFAQILPNSGSNIPRYIIWAHLHEFYLDLIFPSPEIAETSGWINFPQRFDIILIASTIYAAAWGAGSLILRKFQWDGPKNIAEKTVIIFGLGLTALSIFTLCMGKIGFLNAPFFYTLFVVLISTEFWLRRSDRQNENSKKPTSKTDKNKTQSKNRFILWSLIGISPFLLAMALGAMLPSIDFDVREYHIQGPKEYFQNGNVDVLRHNIYTSFPFFTEMLTLLAMVLRNDWYWGAICGKAVLMGFAPLTAVALYAAGNRWFSKETGAIAALIFLTTPWTYRISIIAYAEGGLTFFLFASLFALMLTLDSSNNTGSNNSTSDKISSKNKGLLITGLLAGSAMACKYPGVVQVVIPLGVAATLSPFFIKSNSDKENSSENENHQNNIFKIALKQAAIYSLGVFITMGPWLIKNTMETGNPIYPLLYSVFGGEDFDDQLNEKWKKGHSSKTLKLSDLPVNIIDVTMKSDWLSPLLFGLAPLTFLGFKNQRKRLILLWLFVAYLFASWWILTHRIDRFWVPLIPVVALLAGVGFHFSSNSIWKYASRSFVVATLLYNLGYISTELCGYNGYLVDYNQAQKMTESLSSGVQYINQNLSENDKVLCIGEAAVFDSKIPLVYNTVFDYSIFEQWFSENDPSLPPEKQNFKSAEEIKKILKENKITHFIVNWAEILRYRKKSSYGYTHFVRPERFLQLQKMGIIYPPQNLNYLTLEKLDKEQINEINQWGQTLKTTLQDEEIIISTQIYKVRE